MTTDKLRTEIDSGKAGDKVAYPDPSAAPLGTDDEAAGGAPAAASTAMVRDEQRAGTTGHSPGATDETSRDYSGELVRPKGRLRKIAIIAAIVGGLVATFAGFLSLVPG